VLALLLSLAAAPLSAAPPRSGKSTRRANVAAAHIAKIKAEILRRSKLDRELTRRKDERPSDTTRVIVRLAQGAKLPPEFRRYARRRLNVINGEVADVPNWLLERFAQYPEVLLIDHDRPASGVNYRTGVTIGSRAVELDLGITGKGVGVAVIDSGIASWHDDFTNYSEQVYPYGNQRVSAFVDFVNGRTLPYDDEGHGTHVSGIIAGNGYDSQGKQAGIAPGASLISLKVLDAGGQGTISRIIAALDWVLENRERYAIRVVNMSVGATVTESYWTDPLTLAAKRVVDAGVVVVAAAGNRGRTEAGQTVYGSIVAPGNAPWVLTVGASSTNGTTDRSDDTVPGFSSRGPTAFDYSAKPDLLAPGHGSVSLADPTSASYSAKAQYLRPGDVPTPYLPYLVLSGTSMAAPVVSGAVALMLEANPALTPNAVKAILQYTAQEYAGYDALTQGAGFLNAVGAVRLAEFFASADAGAVYPVQPMWSKKINWGNYRLSGGVLLPDANAFDVGTTWGADATSAGDNIVWGTSCGSSCDNVIWGTSGSTYDNIVWGTSSYDNIVWGTNSYDNIVWGTNTLDNIVWGTNCGGANCDNVIWGTNSLDNIIWGTSSYDNVIWGTSGFDNVIWGTSDNDNIIWGTSDDDNIIWGTSGFDNIIWGTARFDNIIWGTDSDSLGDSRRRSRTQSSRSAWNSNSARARNNSSRSRTSGDAIKSLPPAASDQAVAASSFAWGKKVKELSDGEVFGLLVSGAPSSGGVGASVGGLPVLGGGF
jgi:serine protease AprX